MIHVNPKMKPPWQKRRKWHEKRIKGEKEKRKEKALQGWKNRKTKRKGRRRMTRQIPPSPPPPLPLAASGWEGIEKTGHHGLCCHVSEQITLPHPSTSISRSSREYHEESNDNVKKIIIIESLRSKTTAYFAQFMGDVNERRRIFFVIYLDIRLHLWQKKRMSIP